MSPPSTIDATGSRDVTDALNAFFAGLAPGTTATLPSRARYRAEGIVQIVGARGVTIEGNHATLFAATDGHLAVPPRRGFRAHWPRRREHLEIRDAAGLRLHALSVRGANPRGGSRADAYVAPLEGQAGIAVVGGRDVALDDVTVSDTYGDLVYITGGATSVTVERSRLTRSGRQGIAVVGAVGVRVTDNEISEIGRSVFDIEPPGRAPVRAVTFENNRIGEYQNYLLAARGGGAGTGGITLARNRVDASHGVSVLAGVERVMRTDLRLLDNRGTTRARPLTGVGTGALIQLTNLDHVEMRDNEQPLAGGIAVSLDRVCHLTAAGNVFTGARESQRVVASCGAPTTPKARRTGRTPSAGATSTTTVASTTTTAATDTSNGSDAAPAVAVGVAIGLVLGAGGLLVIRRLRRG